MEEGTHDLSRSSNSTRDHTVESVDTVDSGKEREDRCRQCIFFFADRWDYVLMLFGAVGSCIHGAALPMFLLLFGRLIDSLGSLSKHPHRLAKDVSEVINCIYMCENKFSKNCCVFCWCC